MLDIERKKTELSLEYYEYFVGKMRMCLSEPSPYYADIISSALKELEAKLREMKLAIKLLTEEKR